MKYKQIFCTLFFMLFSYVSISSPLNQSFNTIRLDQKQFGELKSVNDILQDKNGFIWLGSSTGLYRFDGSELKQYTYSEKDPDSLPHFHVNQIFIDHKNEMWIGTGFGLAKYIRSKDSFETFKLEPFDANPVITAIHEDSEQNLWIGTRQFGAIKISPSRDSIKSYSKKENSNTGLSNNFVRTITTDSQGNAWIGTFRGLNRVDKQTNNIEHYFVKKQDENIIGTHIFALVNLNAENLLVGAESGLHVLSTKNYQFNSYEPEKISLDDKHVVALELSDDNLFIGTNADGLINYNISTKNIRKFRNNEADRNSLNSNVIRSIYLDDNQKLWVGTNSGLNTININSKFIQLFKSKDNEVDCLSGDPSFAVLDDLRGSLWLGIQGKGLNRVNTLTGRCHLYHQDNVSIEGLKLDFILDLDVDSKGNIWIASYKEGLVKFDIVKEKFIRVDTQDDTTQEVLSSSFIYKIEVDKDDNIWFGLEQHVVAKLDQRDNSLELFGKEIESQLNTKAWAGQTLQIIGNKVWIGTQFKGLLSYDLKSRQFEQFVRKQKNASGVPEFVTAMKKDKYNNLWLGSRGYGAYYFNTSTGDYSKYTTEDGLSDNLIWNIEVDNNDFVWVATGNGLSVFNKDSDSFTNFYKNDGLQGNDFRTAGHYNPSSNTILLSGKHGINRININNFGGNQDSRRVYFSKLLVNYETVKIGKNSPLKTNLSDTTKIDLNHDENNFAIGYSSVEFDHADKLKYQYRLKGYDEWRIDNSHDRLVNFTNIPNGNYVFEVRVSLNESWDNGQVTSLNITIHPPWWRTNLAYACYILLVIISIYGFISLRTRTLTKRAELLKDKVNKRTQELAEEKDKVEQLLSRKNEEFANVSHEFRTPLTLILGPITQLLTSSKQDSEIKKLNVVQRNGYRLLRMVDQLLNLETFRVKAITQKSSQPVSEIIQLLADAFKDLAEEKGISLSIKEIQEVNFEFTPDAIEKIVVNLLSNAIKYSNSGDSVSIKAIRNGSHYQIEVTDSGIGIPKEKLNSVFDRFNRVLDENSENITGAGIGLALVKSLVESHSGSIKLESQLGQGTSITVTLPIIHEVENIDSVKHANDEIIAMELMSLQSSDTQKTESIEVISEESSKPVALIVEDNADMRNYIKQSIIDSYQVLTAKDGIEGVAIAQEEVPDVIISDVMMPRMDGYQTTQELRTSDVTSHIPVILLTARGDRESRLKGWYEKADDYITKPFDVEELKIRLKNLIEIRNILKRRFSESIFQSKEDDKKVTVESDSEGLDENKAILQQKFIDNLNTILENIYQDGEMSIDELAQHAAMSQRQLFRKLRSILDMTPAEYLRRFRLEKSKPLLAEGKTALFVAIEVGFSSQSYFGKCFKAQYGISPAEYKKQLSN